MIDTNLDNLENAEASAYEQYVQECCPHINLNSLTHLKASIANTKWEDPESSLDFNNIAVMALIEADNTQDLSERSLYWEFAVEALQQGIELSNNSLCKAHLTVAYSLINDREKSVNTAYRYFIEILNLTTFAQQEQPFGLVYLPRHMRKWLIVSKERLPSVLEATNSVTQAYIILLEILCHAQLCFYDDGTSTRFLQLALPLNKDSAILNLQLGVAGLCKYKLEYLTYLHRAENLAPESPLILHSLYLAYKDLRQPPIAEQWRIIASKYAQKYAQNSHISMEWAWATLAIDSPFTYLPFGDNLLIAIESSLRSIVTIVLIAQQDWFEVEMELWRDQIQSGMTVIDVGANVGVYTYSAAQLVGTEGKVIAIEPFAGCIQCLEETRRINQLDCVDILAGAASDRNGTARLSLNSFSELNELIPEDAASNLDGNFQTVACFTLDSLIDQKGLTRIDWLKIDAEGHEIQVLRGCDRILSEFKPNILYENIDGKQQNNTEVAEYLLKQGYQLFYYMPYLKQLVPIASEGELTGRLNIVAMFNGSKNQSIQAKELDKVEKISEERRIINNSSYRIVMVVSGGLEEFIENTVKSIINCNIDPHNIEIFTPRSIKVDLQRLANIYSVMNITAIEDVINQPALQGNNSYFNIGTSAFAEFTLYKWIIIKYLLSQGIKNVIYTDVDIAWRENPIDLLQKINDSYDLAIQTEGECYFPAHFCTGFMSFANTEFSQKLLDSLIELQVDTTQSKPTFHDQLVFNTLVDRNVDLVKNIYPLSEILFANGLSAKLMSTSDEVLEQIQTIQPKPFIFHANCTVGLANKKKMLQRTGNWFL